MSYNYDGISLGVKLSELELEKYNVNIYNNSMVAIPTGNTAADGSPEYIIQTKASGTGTYNQTVAKSGKLYRAISGDTNVTTKSITIEIPAGRYIQVSRYSSKVSEDGLSTGTADFVAYINGTRIGGTPITAYNFNDLSPEFANFNIWEDAVIDTPEQTIVIDGYAFSSTNQINDNAAYVVPDEMLIFGDANNSKLVTLNITTSVEVYFLGLKVSFSEINSDGLVI